MNQAPLILLTGATGYIGGRLLPLLLQQGRRVRCLARHPENLNAPPSESLDIVQGDVFDIPSLESALQDVSLAYYLIHSLSLPGGFEDKDRLAASNFATAARKAGVQRIVYLGGLGASTSELSPHLKSRQEVGDILRESGVEVIEFRASIVIGSGSISFEMIRALVERLPIMITPKWVTVPSQPISIHDTLDYLLQAISLPAGKNRIVEIGGRDVVSYAEIMNEYARQRNLKRWMIPVPVLTPYLSSLWLGLVTPVFVHIGKNLIDSLRNPTVVHDHSAQELFPIAPQGIREAIESALRNEDHEFAMTRWSDALCSSERISPKKIRRYGARLIDSHTREIPFPPEQVFLPIQSIGGHNGWYYANWLWTLRGWLDLALGGIGSRRGRRDPMGLHVGDTVDWWRVEALEENRLLRFYAEMKIPGRAWLQFELNPTPNGSLVRQTAIFDPLGLWGLVYWYLLYPVHILIFSGMLRGIERKTSEGATSAPIPADCPKSRP